MSKLQLKNISLDDCNLCPHDCHVDRHTDKTNFCNNDTSLNIASITIHRGEEPILSGDKGVCNVFFSHCNMQCVYCQNFQISKNETELEEPLSLNDAIERIIEILNTGITHLGFVSPSHQIVQMVEIIEALNLRGYFPKIIYNSNGYDKVSTLKMIEPYVDVYLPDFKYASNTLAWEYSQVDNYNQIVLNAISEMIRQKGKTLVIKNDVAEKGVIIRHLILPNNLDNSIAVLKQIKQHFGNEITLSIMAQYYPVENVRDHPTLNRCISTKEYDKILFYIEKLGFENGFIQEYESADNYLPDFSKSNPFE